MELTVCDLCKRRMPVRPSWRDNSVYYRFRIGRRTAWLAINVLQSKPGKGRRRWVRGRRHLDLCKACTLKAVLAAKKSFQGPQEAHLLNPLPLKRRRPKR